MNLLVFFHFEPKKGFRVSTPWGLSGWSGMSVSAIYAVFRRFCYVGGFGNLGDPNVLVEQLKHHQTMQHGMMGSVACKCEGIYIWWVDGPLFDWAFVSISVRSSNAV